MASQVVDLVDCEMCESRIIGDVFESYLNEETSVLSKPTGGLNFESCQMLEVTATMTASLSPC